MFTWPKIALYALQIAQAIISWLHDKKQMDAGVDKAIAQVSASILAKTAAGKAIAAEVMGMTEAQVDAALKELEPK